jgi:V-type H+-transporting ATPase subunit a
MKEINNNEQTLKKQELELSELRCILGKTAVFFEEAEAASAVLGSDAGYTLHPCMPVLSLPQPLTLNCGFPSVGGCRASSSTPLLAAEEERAGQLGFVTGVIAREKMPGCDLPVCLPSPPNLQLPHSPTHHTHTRAPFLILAGALRSFERLLWRACRGNVFLRRVAMDEAITDPVTNEETFKEVFIVFFQGDELGARVRKICEG